MRREHEPDDCRRLPAASAASAASAMRGVQCFIPVKTGSPSSASSAARVCSVIALSGEESSIPSAPVALDEIGEMLGRDRPAAADVGVVGGDVGEPLRRAVRHQDDGGARSYGDRRHRELADERGEPREHVRVGLRQDAVAEVEDVARPAAARARGRRGRRARRAPTGRAARPGRGCPARRAPRRRRAQPSSSGIRQSRPIDVAARGRQLGAAGASRPVPKWIVGTPAALEDRAPSTERRTRA